MGAQELLDQYGVQVILIEGFEYGRGTAYLLAPSLADPAQTKWKLVYQDDTGMVFMRQPPPGVPALPQQEVFANLVHPIHTRGSVVAWEIRFHPTAT